ncbi:hypothetical protein [Actinoplanes aureus]|uniref:DUF4436 domain-containing protein n=1 Tax=Actinoplanes aureus TaxID=2792083 RepID=A0A931G3T0_9ACTN|nr:hypothetical protein [Actinoplanes aureus]MBG0569202.1 hypothetical protein [Actinoplanes aureus]
MRTISELWGDSLRSASRLLSTLRAKPALILPVLLAAASILVLALGLILSARQLLGQHNDANYLFHQDRGGGGPPEAKEIRPRYEESFASGSETSFIHLRFAFTEFDAKRGTIRGTVAGLIDETAYARQYYGSALPKSTKLTLRSLFTTIKLEVPLVPKVDSESEVKVPLELDAWGEPSTFPGDSYAIVYFFDVGAGMDRPSASVLLGSGLRLYSISGSIGNPYFNILLERRETQRWWVYTLALSPLILFFALAWSSLRLRDNSVALSTETAVGVLALLPLRQVLVPSEISSLTNVDLILGIEFLLFIGWMGWSIFIASNNTQGPGADTSIR